MKGVYDLKTKSKILSTILSVSILSASLSGFVTGSIGVQAAESSQSVSANKYGLKDNIQDGVILHCFDWSYNDIKAELPNIAKAGFTSVQTSPAQPNGTGTWYWLYQPTSFSIGTNGIGTKAELQSLCDEAEKYGIKVIVDVVANHMNGDHNRIDSDLRNSQYWHHFGGNVDWANRWQVTHGEIGMADLATENSYVQQKVGNYIQELKSVGVDGIRWDAAKHIGVPSEGDNFWRSVTQYGLYNYGEILKAPDDRQTGNEGIMKEYTNYITVTDSDYGKTLRDSFNTGNAPDSYGNWCARGISNDKLIYWGESHDTWSNNKDWGYSNDMSQNVIDRAYAVAASRNKVTALYFSRPSSKNKDSIMAGQKGSTHFTSSEVAEINKFHNAMDGKADYYKKSNGCSVITRKDGGAVIVKGSGSGNVSVENGGGYAKSGTYKDAISGNTFTITSSNISGTVGSSGIAVIYEAEPDGPSASVTPGSKSYKTDTLTLTLNSENATNAQYSIDNGAYVNFTDGQKITIGSGLAYGTKTTVTVKATDGKTTSDPETYTYTKVDPSAVDVIYYDSSSTKWTKVNAYFWSDSNEAMMTWPGKAMTKTEGNIYEMEIPEGAEYVIFNNGASQTDDLTLAGGDKIYRNGSWQDYSVVRPTQPTSTAPATTVEPTTATQPTTQPATEPTNKILIGDVDLNSKITVSDATLVQMYVVNMTTLGNDALVAADVNKDSVISIKDATLIQSYVVKLAVDGSYCGTYTGGTEPTQPATTEPATEPTTIRTKNYVYFKNTSGWTIVNAYVWSTNDTTYMKWPGKAMEKIGNNTYRMELPEGAEYIIFNNSSSQTGDLKIPDVNMIYLNGSWSKYTG